MRMTMLGIALCLSLPAAAESQSWKDLKDAAKQQAGQKMEESFNLPQPSPAGAKATILAPADGAEVASPVKVVFGLSGMGIAPAGFNKEGTGHFHILIDDPKVELAQPLPSSDQVKHYGNGQIEASLDLKPGKHTLQLLLADWKHLANNPAVMSEKVTITVN